MMTPVELHQLFQVALMRPRGDASETYHSALSSTAAVLGDETIETAAAWFDYGSEQSGSEVETGVHMRVITPTGVITTDSELSFDGLPDARFIGWSRVLAVRGIARRTSDVSVASLWLETELGNIEFDGARRPLLDEIMQAVRRHVK